MLADHLKKELPALEVFSSAIRYLKSHLIEIIKNRVADIHDEDIHYVLTVPAIWNDSAKQFMREAAIEVKLLNKL
jgi:molecular chaperone DnaK (HSP70)